MRTRAILFAACAVILIALHTPFVRLPFHWDEMGQFVPAALDLYRDGAWIPHSTEPNIHPPGLMALLAVVWSLSGYSILHTRIAMLLVASAGVYLSFLLAIRLGRAAHGAPAFAAAAFLTAAPMFYTQSMMVLLDMPAMVLTVAALLLFLDKRYLACAIVCTVLVLTKETALTTPAVFGAWLLFREHRSKEALYFLAPLAALAGWLVVLHHATGSWFGSASFGQYNVTESLTPVHLLYALVRRFYTLFLAEGHWIGTGALVLAARRGWPGFARQEWTIAASVAMAQVLAVTLLGGAVLDRYLLPVLPVLYAAFAVASSGYIPRWRMASNVALLAALVAGWFWNSPFPVPLENNLAVVDFIALQRDAAEFVEANYPQRRVVTTWPFSVAIVQPEMGYVEAPLKAFDTVGWRLTDLQAAHPGPNDIIVMYSHGQTPRGAVLRIPVVRDITTRMAPPVEATSTEIATLGFVSVARWTSGEYWIEIYIPAR